MARRTLPQPPRSSYVALLLLLLLLSACSVDIVHDLDEPQANSIVAVLQRHGLSAKKQRNEAGRVAKYTVSVRRAAAPRAWRILRERNLPRPPTAGIGDVFKSGSLVPTAAQQQALMRHALAGEITRTLHTIAGVHGARVHIVLPRRDPFSARGQKPDGARASVLVTASHDATVSADDVRKIVSGAVDGLAVANVNVVIQRGKAGEVTSRLAPTLVSIGPFTVAEESKAGLLATLLIGIFLLLGLGLTVLILGLRLRRVRLAAPSTSPNLESSIHLIERSFERSRFTRGG